MKLFITRIIKKTLSIILILSLCTVLFSPSTTVFATVSWTFSGAVLSVEDFNRCFVGSVEECCSVTECSSYQLASAQVSNFQIIENEISMQLHVTYGSFSQYLDFCGEIQKGTRQDQGISTFVGDLYCTTNPNIRVLLFNIFNDSSQDDLFIHPELNCSPHIKLYLMDDTSGHLILLESSMPNDFSDLSVCNISKINSADLLWFWPFVEVDKEIEYMQTTSWENRLWMQQNMQQSTNPLGSLQPYGLWSESLWGDAPILTHRTEVLGGTRYMRSWLYVAYSHSDIYQNGNGGTWWLEYRIAESYTDEYGVTRSGINSYTYTDFAVNFSCGNYTYIESILPYGRLYYGPAHYLSGLTNSAASIGKEILALFIPARFVDYYNNLLEAKDVLENLNKLVPIESEARINDDYFFEGEEYVAAGIDTDYFLEMRDETKFDDNGHANGGNYFRVSTHLCCTTTSPSTSTVNSNGSISFSFLIVDPFEFTETRYTVKLDALDYTVHYNTSNS